MKNKNIKKSDFDADGLSNEEEKLFNTSIFSKDTDSDGLNDFEEIFVYGTDPNNPDTDGDFIPDGAEVKMGSNPKGLGKLRDFLIPHEGNNFYPLSFAPRRVIFHISGALAVKLIVFLFIMFLPAQAWLTPDVLLEQEAEIIRLTNELREGKGVGILSENVKLRSAAFDRAQDMLIKQYFAHISPDGTRFSKWIDDSGYDYKVAGENLAMGFADASGAMEGWKASPTHYDNLVDPDYENIGVSAVDGVMNGYGTTLVVQLFGALINNSPLEEKFSYSSASSDFIESSDSQEVAQSQGQSSTSSPYPYIDESKSVISVNKKDGGRVVVFSAEIYIQGAKDAQALFYGYSIDLYKSPTIDNLWTGSSIIYSPQSDQIFNPVVPPSVVAFGSDGEEVKKDVLWENIVPSNPSVVSQYLFIKKQGSGFVSAILRVSKIYFGAMLAFFSAALILMVFVKIKKQHPKHILFSLGLIAILSAFFMF